MSKYQFFKTAMWGLLTLNMLIIGLYFIPAGIIPKPRPPEAFIFEHRAMNMLELDEDQRDHFHEIAAEHAKQMNACNAEQRKMIEGYFMASLNDVSQHDPDSLMSEIHILENKKIDFTLKHFQEVKSMLKPEQQPFFDEFVKNALQIILDRKKNPPRAKDFE